MTSDEILSRAYYITLSKRPERGLAFETRFRAATGADPVRVFGYDGERLAPPQGWETSRGAFGCCLAHVGAWARVLSDASYGDDDPFLFFEDDAVFCDDFKRKLDEIARAVPQDWDVLYLGGEHLLSKRKRPDLIVRLMPVDLDLIRAYNVNRLHAYVVRAHALRAVVFPRLVRYLSTAPKRIGPSGDETCFDYEFGRMNEEGLITCYAVNPFLCGQGGFGSDTYPGKDPRARMERYWNIDRAIYEPKKDHA